MAENSKTTRTAGRPAMEGKTRRYIVADHFLMKHQGGHGGALGTGEFVQFGGAVDELIKSLGGVRR